MLGTDKRYYYRDDFMFFEFKGIPSEKYNLFLINEGENLLFPASTNASVSYTSPDYQTQTYFLGAKQDQKTFSWNCAAEGISLRQAQEISKWLMPGQQGVLRYENNRYWCYDVVVDSLSDFTKWVQADGTYIITFSLVFKTIGVNSSRGYWQGRFNLYKVNEETPEELQKRINEAAPNEYGIPEVQIVKKDDDKTSLDIYIFNVGNRFQTFSWKTTYKYKYDADGTEQQQIEQNIVLKRPQFITSMELAPVWQYNFIKLFDEKKIQNYSFEYNSLTGLFLANNKFLEDNDDYTNISEDSGAKTILIESCAPARLEGITRMYDELKQLITNQIKVKATPEILDLINTGKLLYVCTSRFQKDREEDEEKDENLPNYNEGGYDTASYTIYPANCRIDLVEAYPVNLEEGTVILKAIGTSFGDQSISAVYQTSIEAPSYLGVYDRYQYSDTMLETADQYAMVVNVSKYNTL